MSISGSYNVVLGSNAAVPNPAASNQIAIGSAAATTYIGGPNALICSSTGLVMDAATTLTVCGPAVVHGKLTASAILMTGELQTGGGRGLARRRWLAPCQRGARRTAGLAGGRARRD